MSNENDQLNEKIFLSSFKVFVRVRPLNEKENNLMEKLYSNSNNKLKNFHKNILIKEDNLLFVIDPDRMDYNVYLFIYKGKKRKKLCL